MKLLISILVTVLPLFSLSLEQAITQAMEHSPLIKKADSQVRYAKTQEEKSRANFLPTLDAGFNWQRVNNTTAFGFSPTHNYNLTARYNLFRGFSDSELLDAARYNTEAQAFLRTAAKSDVRLAVTTAYMSCLKAHKEVLTQQEALNSLQRSYNDTKIRYEQGIIAKNELLLIDSNRLAAEQSLATAKSNLANSYSLLSMVMGVVLKPEEAVDTLNTEVQDPLPYDALLQKTFDRRSELLALQAQRKSLNAEYNAVSSFYPSVNLQGDYIVNDKERYSSGGALVQVKDQTKLTVNVSWNLYNGGADEANRKGILEQQSALEYDVENTRVTIRHQLFEAHEKFHLAKSALNVAKRAKESAEENYRITQDLYEFGQVDTLTMLVAQSNLTAAKNAYNNAQIDLFTAKATIDRISAE